MKVHAVCKQIRQRREELGLSLSQVAARADTSTTALSRYENGWTRFEMETLHKIATALRCRMEVRLEPLPDCPHATSPERLARQLRPLFWDRTITGRDLSDHPRWVVERVLEYGELNDVRAVIGAMGLREFLATVAAAQFSSVKTRNFWALMLRKERLLCTRKFSREPARNFWPF